jgi:hypothetical protein
LANARDHRRDGRPRGSITDGALEAKFLASAATVLGDGRARHLLQMLSAVDHHQLADLLGAIYRPASTHR